MSECVLCSDLNDRGGRIDLPQGFALAADVAPLRAGHMLFHTREHTPSFAALGTGRLRSAKELLHKVMAMEWFAQSDFLAFEHGTSGVGPAAHGCVDHAHIHVLPLAASGEADIALNAFPNGLAQIRAPIAFEDLSELARAEYFWVAGRHLQPKLLEPMKPERQVLRRLIASALSLTSYRTWDLYDLEAAKVTTCELRNQISALERL